jgi:transaldolase
VHPDLAGDTEATIAQALGLWHRLDEPELIGPHVINTMQEQALRAFADHGEVKRTLDADSNRGARNASGSSPCRNRPWRRDC